MRRFVLVLIGLFAALLFIIFTVDIGDISIGGRSLRTIAETEGSKFLNRQLTIGAIRARLWPGRYVLEDVMIAGPNPGDRPFFFAKRIEMTVPLTQIISRRVVLTVELDQWSMTVERTAEGYRIPNMRPKTSGGPRRWDIRVPYVFARNGEFVYDDHLAPWKVKAPNLQFSLVRDVARDQFVGNASFSNGLVEIMNFQPMRADFRTRFKLEGGVARLLSLDLITDGAHSRINGYVNFGAGVEQQYNIESDVDLARMREIFFANAGWRPAGKAQFNGIFRVGGRIERNLSGDFRSEDFSLGIGNAEWRLPHLHGALEWTARHFTVSHADAELLGGDVTLHYGLGPFGQPGGSNATFSAAYTNVDVYRLARMFGSTALEPRGRVAGDIAMDWRNGRFSETLEGSGRATVTPPAGQALASETPTDSDEPTPREKDFQPFRPLGEFAFAGESAFRFTGSSLDFEPGGWVSTPSTFVRFSGHAIGGPVDMKFKATSHDWQRSDRLFTALMSNIGRPTGAIEVGGRGTFDGTLTRSFANPRIAGAFDGRAMYAWKEVWGRATGNLIVEDRYLFLTDAVVLHPGGGRIVTSGKYSLGFPRADGRDEIDAHIRAENMPLEPLKNAFTLMEWPIEGRLAMADIRLTGRYERPGGGGQLLIENGLAWSETFASARSGIEFGGDGSLRLTGLEIMKGQGTATGSAWLSWADKSYAFNLRSPGLQIEDLSLLKFDPPFSGRLQLHATGAGSFDSAEWTIEGSVPDLYVGDEGIGVAVFKLSLARNVLTIEKLTANSSTEGRFRADCTGAVATTGQLQATLHCGLTETSIDPYLKFFMRDMPLTRGIVTGTASLSGPLRDRSQLSVNVNLTTTNFQLFDYDIRNDGPIQISFKNDRFTLDRVRFAGEGTEGLEFSGDVNLAARTANVRANGQASLKVLQAFYPAITADGTAKLSATLVGPFDSFELRGRADLDRGAFRHRDMPQGIRQITGPITMERDRISVDGVKAVLGDGAVEFGGVILLDGYRPVEFDLNAEGRAMHLRYPEGLQSTASAFLRLTGPVKSPTLSGTVDIFAATYATQIDTRTGLFGVLGLIGGEDIRPAVEEPALPTVPLNLDIHVRAGPPSLRFVDNRTAELSGSGDAYIRGTIDKPIVTGRLRLDRAEWVFSGYRYRLITGSVDFSNPDNFEPFFDVVAETEIRQHGQSYRVTLRVSGTLDKLEPVLTSEPWLPELEIVSMLLGESADLGSAEIRSRLAPQDAQARALRSAGVAILTSPITATVGTAVQRVTTIDSVQVVPILNEADLRSGNPSARLILGKRISNRVYLTYSRTLTGTQDELILVEFDQNDNISWVLSRNEDRSFALDFRLRYTGR